MATAERWHPGAERSAATLIADVGRLAAELVGHEASLARAEIGESLGRLRGDGAVVLAGTALAVIGLIGCLASAILGLATVLAPWLAALVIGGGMLAIGLLVLWLGFRGLSSTRLTPDRALKSLHASAEWARGRMS